MNKYIRMAIEVPTGIVKTRLLKIVRGKRVLLPIRCAISPNAELTIDRGAEATIGSDYRQRSGSHVCVRKNAKLRIGKNVSINYGCMIVCHDEIVIGNNVQFSPNIMVYDHDHDFRAEGGIKSMKYKEAPIEIGDNVWIGANTVILRGSVIGEGSVIGAGSVIKGTVPANTVVVQKRECKYIPLHGDMEK